MTSTLVFEGDGVIGEYVGGYEDWLRQRTTTLKTALTGDSDKTEKAAATADNKRPAPKQKLSYKEQRELDGLPDQIEDLEAQKADIEQQIADPAFYQQQDKQLIAQTLSRLEELSQNLESAYARWEELSRYA